MESPRKKGGGQYSLSVQYSKRPRGENETLGDLKESVHINGETCSRLHIEAQTLSIQKLKRRRRQKRMKTKNAIVLRKDTEQPTDSNLVLCSVPNSIVEIRLQGSSPHVFAYSLPMAGTAASAMLFTAVEEELYLCEL